MSVCPYDNRPGQDGLRAHFTRIAEATSRISARLAAEREPALRADGGEPADVPYAARRK